MEMEVYFGSRTLLQQMFKGRLLSKNEMHFNYLAAALGPLYMTSKMLQQQKLKDRVVGGLHNKAAVRTKAVASCVFTIYLFAFMRNFYDV